MNDGSVPRVLENESGLLGLDRIRLSRGRLLKGGAAVLGVAAVDGLWGGAPALAAGNPEPRPIPGGFDQNFVPVPSNPFIHALPPAVGFDMSTITDFKGIVGGTEVQGTARGSDGSTYWFDCDMRFMVGDYIALDGRRREKSFVFI